MIIENGLYRTALKFYLGTDKKILINLSYLNIKTIYFILLKSLDIGFSKRMEPIILVDLKLNYILDLLCINTREAYEEFYNSNKEFYSKVQIHDSFKNYLVNTIKNKNFVFAPVTFYNFLYENNVQLFVEKRLEKNGSHYKRDMYLTFVMGDYSILIKKVVANLIEDTNSFSMSEWDITIDGKEMSCTNLSVYLENEIKRYL